MDEEETEGQKKEAENPRCGCFKKMLLSSPLKDFE